MSETPSPGAVAARWLAATANTSTTLAECLSIVRELAQSGHDARREGRAVDALQARAMEVYIYDLRGDE